MHQQDAAAPRFSCQAGDVVGWRDGDVLRATGIRYARAARYEAPVAEPPSEVITATSWSAACPQAGSPLLHRMFPDGLGDLDEDEHCQRLSITMPLSTSGDDAPGDRLPVMVFLHGGSYVNGAGDVPIHDPRALVRDEGVVVVSVTYRLGLFGYLGGTDRPANLGLLDQIEALRWVQRNIASFGGDPGNVTVFGESAGGDAIVHLMISDGASGLFRRAIVQSAPLGISRGRADMTAAMVHEAAGIPADATAADVNAHYERVNGSARPFGLLAGMPFGVQYGHHPLPQEGELDAAWEAVAPDVELLIGTNSRETSFFVSEVPPVARLAGLPVVGPTLVEPLVRALTWRIYTRDSARFVRRHRRAGGRASRYTLSWGPRGSRLRGAHTIDLALLFPHRAGWQRSPLLAGATWEEVEEAGRPVRRIWAEFARTGRVDGFDCPHVRLH